MSQRTLTKTKTTMISRSSTAIDQPSQAQMPIDSGKHNLTEANKLSINRDQTRSNSDNPVPQLDLGSKWCSDEIEIFFTSKFPTFDC